MKISHIQNILFTYFLISFLGVASIAQTQIDSSKVLFSYDASGNRILKNVNVKTKAKTNNRNIIAANYKSAHSLTVDNLLIPVSSSSELPSFDSLLSELNSFENSAKNKPSEKDNFTASPNPSSNIISINKEGSTEKEISTNVAIYDMNGKLIQQFINIKIPFTIDLANYSSGVYYLKFLFENKIKIVKIIRK